MSENNLPRHFRKLSKRNFLKSLGVASVGSGLVAKSSQRGSAGEVGGTEWPQYYNRDFEREKYSPDGQYVTSAGTQLELIDSTYVADRWRFYFRTETDIGHINHLYNYPDAVGTNLNGSHILRIEETENKDDMDSYHGSEEYNFGVTGEQGPTPDWGQIVYSIGSAVAGKWDARVGNLITAADIIYNMVHPYADDGDNFEGIQYDWTVYGEGMVGNWMRWTTEYLPKDVTGNDNHQFEFTSSLDGIPDGPTSTSTSKYSAEWTVDLGSMYEPASMSSQEKKQYGVTEIQAHQLSDDVLAINPSIATEDTIYRATNPPVSATLKGKE